MKGPLVVRSEIRVRKWETRSGHTRRVKNHGEMEDRKNDEKTEGVLRLRLTEGVLTMCMERDSII